jgi:hypothetical protein
VEETRVADSWRLLRWHLDNAITDLKQAGVYTKGKKCDADGNVILEPCTHPLAAENRASQQSVVTASLALTGVVHADGRYVLAPATEHLSNFEDVQRELSDYMHYDVLGVDKCPLEWWWQHKRLFPGLAAVARNFLCLPATSAAVERFFICTYLSDGLRRLFSTKRAREQE